MSSYDEVRSCEFQRVSEGTLNGMTCPEWLQSGVRFLRTCGDVSELVKEHCKYITHILLSVQNEMWKPTISFHKCYLLDTL